MPPQRSQYDVCIYQDGINNEQELEQSNLIDELLLDECSNIRNYDHSPVSLTKKDIYIIDQQESLCESPDQIKKSSIIDEIF